MNPNFRGRFDLKVDPKGRLSLPSSIRDCLPTIARSNSREKSGSATSQIVITNSRYQNLSCLHAYSLTEWEALERKISRLPSLNQQVQAFQRFYLSGGQAVEIDAQNRILIPQSLRRFANLESQVVVVGLGNKLEIWSEQNWSGVFSNLTDNFEETMAAVSNFEDEGEES